MRQSAFRQNRTTPHDVIGWAIVIALVTLSLGVLAICFTFALDGVLGYFTWPM